MPCLPSVLVHDLWYQWKGDIQKEVGPSSRIWVYTGRSNVLVWACSLSVESTGIALCSPSPQLDLTGGSKSAYVVMCMSVLHVKYVYHACSSRRGTATIFVLGLEPVSFARANSSKPLLCLYSMFFNSFMPCLNFRDIKIWKASPTCCLLACTRPRVLLPLLERKCNTEASVTMQFN